MVVGPRRAEVVDASEVLLEALRHEVEEVGLVERSLGPTLGAGPVVAHHHDDRVVELADLVDRIDHALHLGIGVREEGGVHLHHPCVEPLLISAQRIPRRHPGRPLGELRTRRQQSRCHLTLEDLVAPGVPALVEVSPVALDVVGRGLVGSVAGPRREPEEEGLLGSGGSQIAQEEGGPVSEVFGEVIALLRGLRRLDVVVVVHELRVVLVGLAAHEPVEAFEPAAEGPLVAGAAHRHPGGGCEVPLADREGGVAVAQEDLREEPVLLRDRGVVSREARRELHDACHAVRVVVAAGEQACPCRRTERSGVEVREAVAGLRQPVEAGRRDVGAVAPELRIPDIIEEHDDDVRRALRRGLQRWPPRLGVVVRAADDAFELGTGVAHRDIVASTMPVCRHNRYTLISRSVRCS